MAVKARPIVPCDAQTSELMLVSTTGRKLEILPGARRTIVPIAVLMSLPNRGVGLSGMIKNEWEYIRSSHMQPKGWETYLVIGLPLTPRMVAYRLERVPGLERKTENVAPVSRRKSVGFPSTSRIIQGSGVPMVTWDKGITCRSAGPHQSGVGV